MSRLQAARPTAGAERCPLSPGGFSPGGCGLAAFLMSGCGFEGSTYAPRRRPGFAPRRRPREPRGRGKLPHADAAEQRGRLRAARGENALDFPPCRCAAMGRRRIQTRAARALRRGGDRGGQTALRAGGARKSPEDQEKNSRPGPGERAGQGDGSEQKHTQRGGGSHDRNCGKAAQAAPAGAGCAAVDRRSGIRDCTGCGYYRPLSTDLLLGMACHYSLDTGQLREVPPAVCFRRALHRARRPGPGRPRKQREEVSDMTPKTAQDPPAAAGAQSASPAPVMRAKTPVGQGAPDAGETPPAPIARRRTARRTPAQRRPPPRTKRRHPRSRPFPQRPRQRPLPRPPLPGKNTGQAACPAAGDIPGKTDGPAAGETPAEKSAKPPAPASREIPAGGIFTGSPAASLPGRGGRRLRGKTPTLHGAPLFVPPPLRLPAPRLPHPKIPRPKAPALRLPHPKIPRPKAPAPRLPRLRISVLQFPRPRSAHPRIPHPKAPHPKPPPEKGRRKKLEQLLERAAPAAVEALLRTVQDERASCAQRLDAAKILLERASPRAGGGEGVLRVVLEDGAAELIE